MSSLNLPKMEKRINLQKVEPAAYKAMYGLENYLASAPLNNKLKELIKIRASQINGCAYCIEIHTTEALKNGETNKRIFALSAWWESPLFDDIEKVVLKMTEEITLISNKGLTKDTYEKATNIFSENEIAAIIMQIGIINMWNRIAVSTSMMHE